MIALVKPATLNKFDELQTQALVGRGANPSFGARLAETIYQAGVRLMETVPIQGAEKRRLLLSGRMNGMGSRPIWQVQSRVKTSKK